MVAWPRITKHTQVRLMSREMPFRSMFGVRTRSNSRFPIQAIRNFPATDSAVDMARGFDGDLLRSVSRRTSWPCAEAGQGFSRSKSIIVRLRLHAFLA